MSAPLPTEPSRTAATTPVFRPVGADDRPPAPVRCGPGATSREDEDLALAATLGLAPGSGC